MFDIPCDYLNSKYQRIFEFNPKLSDLVPSITKIEIQ